MKSKVQQFFEKTLWHLSKQDWKESLNEDGSKCMYFSPSGRKCAVGCHIPEEKYRESMEDMPAHSLVEQFPHLDEVFKDIPVGLMVSMQAFHDRMMHVYNTPEKRRLRMEIIAQEYGLEHFEPKRGFYFHKLEEEVPQNVV